MSCAFVLVGFVFVIYVYANDNEDRYYFQSILEALRKYPFLKQRLLRRCSKELDKCKDDRILRAYTNMIKNKDLQKLLNRLIECFVNSQMCRRHVDRWKQWSRWSSCSVTCGIGYTVRSRSCQRDQQCLTGSVSMQSNSCYLGPCVNRHQPHHHYNPHHHHHHHHRDILTTKQHRLMLNKHADISISDDLHFILILIFPCLITSLCVPLWIVYYYYEFDFKIHSITSQTLSICNRHFDMQRSRINTSQ